MPMPPKLKANAMALKRNSKSSIARGLRNIRRRALHMKRLQFQTGVDQRKESPRRSKFASDQRITLGDYVLEQPPVYSGPPEPEKPDMSPSGAETVPVVADF